MIKASTASSSRIEVDFTRKYCRLQKLVLRTTYYLKSTIVHFVSLKGVEENLTLRHRISEPPTLSASLSSTTDLVLSQLLYCLDKSYSLRYVAKTGEQTLAQPWTPPTLPPHPVTHPSGQVASTSPASCRSWTLRWGLWISRTRRRGSWGGRLAIGDCGSSPSRLHW
jgi:hypothetical protein